MPAAHAFRFRRKDRMPVAGTVLDFTPMIDVVFLLLIFFMCATRFKQIDSRLDALLPQSGQLTKPRQLVPPEALTIFVRDDALMRASSDFRLRALRKASYYLASRDAAPVADVRTLLPLLARLALNPGQRVLIAPYDEAAAQDQRVPFFNIVNLLDVCKMAGIQDVSFQAPAWSGALK